MAYKVIHNFADKTDNFHVYNIGDKFPRSGVKVPENRFLELASANNDIGQALIQEIKPKKKESK